jgi:hypothetical protein
MPSSPGNVLGSQSYWVEAVLHPILSPLRACLKTRLGVPPLGGAATKPPKGGTPNLLQRVSMVFFKQALRPRRVTLLNSAAKHQKTEMKTNRRRSLKEIMAPNRTNR